MKWFEKYSQWVEFSEMKLGTVPWIILSIVIGLAVGFASYVLSMFLIQELTLIPIAFGAAVLILMLGYPYMKTDAIIASVEKNFSDALKQMADTLKSGDTYESALREVADSDYGKLSEEMGFALRRLEEGENLETSLLTFSDRINSKLVKRTITIILDAIRTGSSLADVMEEISEDVRDYERIKADRKSNTTMQFLFMAVAGGAIAPLIFGEVAAIMMGFSSIALPTMTAAEIAAAGAARASMLFLIQGYLLIEVVGSGAMMATIRNGKLSKSVIYIPLLLLVAFLAYYAAFFVVKGMLAGAI